MKNRIKLKSNAKSASSPTDLTAIQSRRTILSRKITAFEKAQETFMPGLESHIQKHPELGKRQPHNPELIPLLLPSAFNTTT